MSQCHMCHQDTWNKGDCCTHNAGGLDFCSECYESLKNISETMYSEIAPPRPKQAPLRWTPPQHNQDAVMLPPFQDVYDELQVTPATNVARFVAEGWVPLMLLYTDQAEEFTDYCNNLSTKHFAVERVAMFLMGRKNAEAKLDERLKTQLEKVRALGKEREELEKQIDGFEKRVEMIEYERKRAQEQAQESSGKTHEERQLRYKLEKHVSVLRNAVGELKAKELLGEE